jgi:hypothetical protein
MLFAPTSATPPRAPMVYPDQRRPGAGPGRGRNHIGPQARCGFFPGLVVTARAKHPIPSRTRPLSAVAPMVLRLKTWESRSPPNLERSQTLSTMPTTRRQPNDANTTRSQNRTQNAKRCKTVAGWSSPVARQAHNLKVTGSNPVPATRIPDISCRSNQT